MMMTNDYSPTMIRDAIDIARNACANAMIDIPLNADSIDAFDSFAIIMNRCARIIDALINDRMIPNDDAINDAIAVAFDFLPYSDDASNAFAMIMN